MTAVGERQLQVQVQHILAVPGLWPPSWPMGLTMLRLVLLPVFLWVLLAGAHARGRDEPSSAYRYAAVAIFAVMAATDKLDGYLARRLNQTSKIGTLLDPVADKLLVACSIMLLSFEWVAPSGFKVPWPVVAAVYGKDVVVVAGCLALLSLVGRATVTPRPLGKVGTALQLALIIATLVAPDLARLGDGVAYWLVRGLWWVVGLVAAVSAADYVVQGWRQFSTGRRRVMVGEAVRER